MGKWRWTGVAKDGARVTGEDDVRDKFELKRILKMRGVKPIRLTPPSALEIDLGMWMVENGFAKPFTDLDLMNFTSQMAVMIGSGVPLIQSIEILYKQEKNKVLQLTLRKISTQVAAGKSLSEALREQKGFTEIYCNLVKAGESTGSLDGILNKLSEYLEKVAKIKAQIKSAMTYPSIVMVVGAAVIYTMLMFVVPKFTEMLTDSGQEIPAITQFVIDFSLLLQQFGLVGLVIVVAAFIALSAYIKTPGGRPYFDRFMMKMPIFGIVVIKGNLAQFTRTMATMLTSGMAIIDSLDICIATVENVVMRADLRKVRMAVEVGKTFAGPLEKIPYFPAMVAQMIRIGEQTGTLDQMLEKVSTIFERDVEASIGAAVKLIEPIILVVLGGIVGTILIAMYLPMFMSAGGAS